MAMVGCIVPVYKVKPKVFPTLPCMTKQDISGFDVSVIILALCLSSLRTTGKIPSQKRAACFKLQK